MWPRGARLRAREVAGPRGHLEDDAQQHHRGGFWLEREVWEESPALTWQLKRWKRVGSPKERAQRAERPIFWEKGNTPCTRLWALKVASGSPWVPVWGRDGPGRREGRGSASELATLSWELAWPRRRPGAHWGPGRGSRQGLRLLPTEPCRLLFGRCRRAARVSGLGGPSERGLLEQTLSTLGRWEPEGEMQVQDRPVWPPGVVAG